MEEKFKRQRQGELVGTAEVGGKGRTGEWMREAGCSECRGLRESLAEVKKALTAQERKAKILLVQKGELGKELNVLKGLYQEVKRNSENFEYDDVLKQKDAELKSLKEELKRTQELFKELTIEYDSFTMNVSRIPGLNENEELERVLNDKHEEILEKDEYIEELCVKLREKESALGKAQSTIRRLNEECEFANQQVFELKEFKADCHTDMGDPKVKSLTQQLRTLKSKYKQLKSKNWEESEARSFTEDSLLKDKLTLENALEELNSKFQEMEQMSTHRLGMFYETCDKIQLLEDTLIQKDKEMKKIREDFEGQEVSRQLEFAALKQSTKLIFEDLKMKKSQNEESNPLLVDTAKRNLKMIVKELTLRDVALRKEIYRMIEVEAFVIKRCLSEMDVKVENFKADFEKWKMQNEEMEQRLVQVENNNLKLIRVIKDLQKIIAAKDIQFEEVVKLYTRAGGEMQASIDFFSVELDGKHNYIVKELLPTSYSYFSKTLSDAHIEIYKKTHRMSNN